ncbi:hypothetical protein M3P05_14715 [Sansalvadorimonas sp. 2012CJ34-2]|uniref:Uncharacterized protein n=1 Tax=Parendozoicomonas callyspongiae TaxID=2942213 RepID=A0ABT0PIU2_9GAMM|nr:hypothetical protein [Sansalvadorimonas sp. 2012CJ34-2]MCL6271176.1 hypothetical protein [Sansalvadorimonas sp. 2012CJ34-2]
MESVPASAAYIVSHLNVADEALRAFYLALMGGGSVNDYLNSRHIYFASPQVENTFLSHILALSEYALTQEAY